MATVSVNGVPVAGWSPQMVAIARRVAMRVLDGCGIPSTDVVKDGMITVTWRRQCTESERRKVVEKYLLPAV